MKFFYSILFFSAMLTISAVAFGADRLSIPANIKVIPTQSLVMIGQRDFDHRPVTLLGERDEKTITTDRIRFTGKRNNH